MSDSPWKNSQGKFYTLGLFLELGVWDSGNDTAIYTTKDEDWELNGKTYISFKRRYLELADPTEYLVATELLGGWRHLQALYKSPACRKFLEECKEELEVKLRSMAIKNIASDAISESKSAVSSAKWLADKGWELKETKSVGRPKKKKEDELVIDPEVEEALERMGYEATKH